MQTKKAKKFPQIRVSEDVYKLLVKEAKSRGISLGEMIKILIEK